MSKKTTNQELLEEVERLKKDVYFSYVLKLNHRYIFKDLYSIFERINYISINVNQYFDDVKGLYKKIDTANVEFTEEDLSDLEQVKRTKEISLKELEFYIKNTKNFISTKSSILDKNIKYYRYALPILVAAAVFI